MDELVRENKQLKEELEHLKTLMHNYTKSRKDYYEKNKEAVKARAKESMKKLVEENPDKLKEYARRAYLKQKEKKRLEAEKRLAEGAVENI